MLLYLEPLFTQISRLECCHEVFFENENRLVIHLGRKITSSQVPKTREVISGTHSVIPEVKITISEEVFEGKLENVDLGKSVISKYTCITQLDGVYFRDDISIHTLNNSIFPQHYIEEVVYLLNECFNFRNTHKVIPYKR